MNNRLMPPASRERARERLKTAAAIIGVCVAAGEKVAAIKAAYFNNPEEYIITPDPSRIALRGRNV